MQNLERLAELAKELPANYKEAATTLVERMGEVIEGLGDKPVEWRPSTLKLVQATSDRSKLPKGANIGSLILGEEIVKQPLKVIPLRYWTSRQYWNPDMDKQGMICSSPDGERGFKYGECRACPYSKFDEEKNKSQCNKTITVLAVTEDLSNIFFINFSKTNYTNGMDWTSLMRKAGVAPHKRVYELSAETSKKAKNVEVIKVENCEGDDSKVNEKILAFVNELFTISGEDRKASLVKFAEYMEARKSNALLEAPDTHTVELLPAAEDDAPAAEAPAAEAPAKGSGKYKL